MHAFRNIRQFKVLRQIGKGGESIVFLAYNEEKNRYVALKTLLPAYWEDTTRRNQLIQSAVVQRALIHPNIVGFYSSFEEFGNVWVEMEYVEGVSLYYYLGVRGLLKENEAVSILMQLLEALDYTHALGIIHRDISPANIILLPDGTAKLTDFGHAQHQSDSGIHSDFFPPGKCVYLSPEQISNPAGKDFRSDIFSLGILFYEMLSGATPYGVFAEDKTELFTEIRSCLWKDPRARNSSVSEQMVFLLNTMTARKPGGRYQTCAACTQALRAMYPNLEKIPISDCSVIREDELHYVSGALTVFFEPSKADSEGFIPILLPAVKNSSSSDIPAAFGSFKISKYPVTQKEWMRVMKTNPSYFQGDDWPVESITWFEALEYCNTRSLLAGRTPVYEIKKKKPLFSNQISVSVLEEADGYRLPTEAEWEYAARGGSDSEGYTFSGSEEAFEVAWFEVNSKGTTKSVGLKLPNEVGLFDMSGNVWEFCFDRYEDAAEIKHPIHANDGKRAVRGGSFENEQHMCAIAYRSGVQPEMRSEAVGFRVLLRR